ncbi:MAG: hypothetical protein EAX86_03890 [Candidatus Heimdallarchaeota archaeon]|nr:hypothetical protein [Candidatus Heimdallarchaeota archaeon]
MGLIETLFLSIPLFITTILSFLNFLSFFRLYRQEAEATLFHIALVFLSSGGIFSLFLIAWFSPSTTQLSLIFIVNIVVWFLFLEIGNSYLSAFMNRTNALERYVLPIFGAAIGISLFNALNPEVYLIINPLRIEAGIYIISIFAVFYLFIMAYNRINMVLGNFDGEELSLLILTQRLFIVGGSCLIFTFISVFLWLLFKGIPAFSLDIVTWNLLDWMVYFNVALYAGVLLGALIYSQKIEFKKIDINTILNILDSPQN